ncbi:MAG: hypothetical protein ACOYH0_09060 [Saccharofermentanales bacterium]
MGINDMKMMIRYSLGGEFVAMEEIEQIDLGCNGKVGAQLMILLVEGTINGVEGLKAAMALPSVTDFIQYYEIGGAVKKEYIGTLQQHFGRFTMIADDVDQPFDTIRAIHKILVIYNTENARMNVLQFDLHRLN